MNLSKKKKLAKKTFNVGEDRIVFLESRLDEIKDAITKQDIRDLQKSGAILIKEQKGRKKSSGQHRFNGKNRSTGNIRKKARKRKKEYMILTRKLRKHLTSSDVEGKLKKEQITDIRKKIRNRYFRSKFHLKEHIGGIKK
jgi:large subunit ribosomal protein L19e